MATNRELNLKNLKMALHGFSVKNAENIKDKNGSLGKSYFDIVHKRVSNMRDEYYDGNEKKRAELRINVNETTSKLQAAKETIHAAANIILNDDGKSDLSNGATLSQRLLIAHVLNEESPKKLKKDGFTWNTKDIPGWKELGGEIKDIKIDDLNRALVLKDHMASSEFLKYAGVIKQQGIDYKNKVDGATPFNRDKVYSTAIDFITPENEVSWWHDDLMKTNTTVYDFFKEHPDFRGLSEDARDRFMDVASNPDNPAHDYYNSEKLIAETLTEKIRMAWNEGAGESNVKKLTPQELIEKYS